MAHLSSRPSHFFLPPALTSSLRSQEITLPSITTPFPSMNATLESPSQFLIASHKTNGRISDFDFVRDVQHLDLCVKFFCLPQSGIFFVDHHVPRSRHVVLVQTLDPM